MTKVCKKVVCLKEKATKKQIVSFDRVYQRTFKALGVSYTSVHRIMNDKRPCKSNRPKERATVLDDFDHCIIIFTENCSDRLNNTQGNKRFY